MTMRYYTWMKKYKPVIDEHFHQDGWEDIAQEFETDGKDVEFLNTQNPLCIWTEIDVGTSKNRIVSGARLVNRVAYYLTEIPFKEGEHIVVFARF